MDAGPPDCRRLVRKLLGGSGETGAQFARHLAIVQSVSFYGPIPLVRRPLRVRLS